MSGIVTIWGVIVVLIGGLAMGHQSNQDQWLEARRLYYAAIEDKSQVEPAIDHFRHIQQEHETLKARAQVYIGGLYALKAKYAFWPQSKLKWVKRGLKEMDAGIALNPDDLEARYVRATICHNLPGFLNKGDEARQDFAFIISNLNISKKKYSTELLKEIAVYLLEKVEMSDADIAKVMAVKEALTSKID